MDIGRRCVGVAAGARCVSAVVCLPGHGRRCGAWWRVSASVSRCLVCPWWRGQDVGGRRCRLERGRALVGIVSAAGRRRARGVTTGARHAGRFGRRGHHTRGIGRGSRVSRDAIGRRCQGPVVDLARSNRCSGVARRRQGRTGVRPVASAIPSTTTPTNLGTTMIGKPTTTRAARPGPHTNDKGNNHDDHHTTHRSPRTAPTSGARRVTDADPCREVERRGMAAHPGHGCVPGHDGRRAHPSGDPREDGRGLLVGSFFGFLKGSFGDPLAWRGGVT